MTHTVYLGIDPGASGGLVALHPDGQIDFKPMPSSPKDILAWFENVKGYYERQVGEVDGPVEFRAVLELVSGYIGGPGDLGSTMFNFGTSFGQLRMACMALDIPCLEVRPQQWQKALGIPPRKKGKGAEAKAVWKRRLKKKAQELFPQLLVSNDTADALLMAHYCRLLHEGKEVTSAQG